MNWDSFKWRNHQPDIGRFFNVDPLAEKYVYNSPYAFSENRVINAIELEGLEALIITGSNHPRSPHGGVSRQRLAAPSAAERHFHEAGAWLLNPPAGTRVGSFERGSTNMTSVSGRIARHVAANGNMTGRIGGEQNAFRHALWSASITNAFGSETAMVMTNAHEAIHPNESATVDFSMDLIQNADLADGIVDFLNNAIGRGIAENLGDGATSLDIARAVLQTQMDEGLWTVTTADDGSLSIGRTRITQEQFDQANATLNTLDENGFNEADRQQLEDDQY